MDNVDEMINEYEREGVPERQILACLVMLVLVPVCLLFLCAGTVRADNAPACDVGALEELGYINVSDLWTVAGIPLLYARYDMRYGLYFHAGEYVTIGGMVSRWAYPRYLNHSRYKLLFAGWYQGDDGNPHPGCGVWVVSK